MSWPALATTTDSDPLVFFEPDHAPDAEHDVAFDEDQARVMESSTNCSVSDASRLRDGATATGILLLLFPPPQEPKNNVTVIAIKNLFIQETTFKASTQFASTSTYISTDNSQK